MQVANEAQQVPNQPGELELALKYLQSAVVNGLNSPDGYFELARAEYLSGSLPKAAAALQQCLALDDKHYPAWLWFAEVKLRQNQPDAALDAAQKAIALPRSGEEAVLLAAAACEHLGEAAQGAQLLENFLQNTNGGKTRRQYPAYLMLARCQLAAGEGDKARLALDNAVKRLPKFGVRSGYNLLALEGRICRLLQQTDEALDAYRRALELAPEQTALRNELGEALLEAHRPEEALVSFKEAIRRVPTEAVYHYNAGRAAMQSLGELDVTSKKNNNRLQSAVRWLEKAIKLAGKAPQYHRYYFELAKAYQIDHDFDRMLPALETALELVGEPNGATVSADAPTQEVSSVSKSAIAIDVRLEYLRLYALACLQTGNYLEAENALNRVLNYHPEDHSSLHRLGELYLRRGLHAEAFNKFREAELHAPDMPRYLASMSQAALLMGRLKDAEEYISDAYAALTERGEVDFYVKYQLGAVMLATSRPREALDPLMEAATMEPDNADYRYAYGNALAGVGKLEEAVNHYRAALSTAYTMHRWHAELGEIYLQLKVPRQAVECFNTALSVEPGVASYHYLLAVALGQNGDGREAVSAIRRAMANLPEAEGAEWHCLMGYLLTEQRRYGEAKVSLERAVELDPANPDYIAALAHCRRFLGEPSAEVRSLLEEALAIDPENLSTVNELAELLAEDGYRTAAFELLENSLQEVLS